MSAATDNLRDEIAAQILAALDYRMDPHGAVWECKVGGTSPHSSLPPGSDSPMRDAVERAYRDITGQEAEFCFSGWGGALSPNQRDVVENRVRETWQERDAVVAFLDRYAAAIRAEERERAAGIRLALIRLSNEVHGSFPLFEPLARREIGNTNYTIMMQRAEEARAALAAYEAERGKE